MTVWVCGAGGYVGSNLLRLYGECQAVPRGEFPAPRAYDAVINLSCYGHRPGDDDIDTMVRVNTMYPIKLYESLPKNVVMVHACSSSERDDPGTQYAKTKSVASKFLYGKATLAYIYTVFGGINEPNHRFMRNLIEKARHGGSMVVEQPNSMRDFIHVDRVCEGLMRLTKENPPLLEAHLGGGKASFLDVIANIAVKMSGGKLFVIIGKGRGKMLYPAPNPYVTSDLLDDLRREIECG